MSPTLPARPLVGVICFLGIALALPAGGASSEGPAKVILLPFVGTGEVSAEAPVLFTTSVRTQLKGREDVEYVSPWSAPGAKPEGVPHDARLQGAVETARQNLRAHDFKAATEGLEKGLARATASPAELDFDRMQEAQLWLAVSFFRGGEVKRARAVLATLLRFAPDYRLPAGTWPAVFRKELARARSKLRRQTTVTLTIIALKDAVITIDGRPAGTGRTRRKVSPGRHFVQVEKQGAVAGAAPNVPARGLTLTLTPRFRGPRLKTPAVALEGTSLDARLATRLGQLCEATGARGVLVGALVVDARGTTTVNGALFLSPEGSFHLLPRMALTAGPGAFEPDAATWVALATEQLRAPSTPAGLPVDLGVRAALKDTLEGVPEISVTDTATHVDNPPAWTPTLPAGPALSSSSPRKSRVPWWVWTVAGAAVAGGGAFAVVKWVDRPVTGTVTARW